VDYKSNKNKIKKDLFIECDANGNFKKFPVFMG